MSAQERYAALTQAAISDDTEPFSIELVFAEPLSVSAVTSRVGIALPGAALEVAAAFDAGEDLYFFVDLPGVDARGQEAEAFALARALRVETQARDAHPVLADSLYGAHHVGSTQEGLLSFCETPRDNSLPFGWHHPRIDTLAAWQHTRGAGSTVAVIDTGYSDHAELQGVRASQGEINLVEGGNDASDRFSGGFLTHPGHGTLVMSVVASRGTANAAGQAGRPGAITGAAPEAKIMPIRAIRSVIDMTQRRIGRAIDHATREGADVIVMALGGPNRIASTEAALRRATAAGVITVCAAGNCWPSVVFPAAYAPLGICTAVAALQPDLRPWDKSGRGGQVTLSAFGEQVWGAAKNSADDPPGGIRSSQGTTLATSMTAGVAALWVARHGGRQALRAIADARGTTVQALWNRAVVDGLSPPAVWTGSGDLGAGVLDAGKALAAPLADGAEAPAAPGLVAASTLDVLQAHLANASVATEAAAATEVTPEMSDFAAEMLWLSYRAGARRRMAEASHGAEAPPASDTPSKDLTKALAHSPGLRAALGV